MSSTVGKHDLPSSGKRTLDSLLDKRATALLIQCCPESPRESADRRPHSSVEITALALDITLLFESGPAGLQARTNSVVL